MCMLFVYVSLICLFDVIDDDCVILMLDIFLIGYFGV